MIIVEEENIKMEEKTVARVNDSEIKIKKKRR